MHSILVTDYMNNNPSVVNLTTNVRDAVQLMLKEKITGVPVVDDTQSLVGYLSEQDCIEEMLNDAFYCEEPAAVSKVMQKELLTVGPRTSIVEIAQTIIKNRPKNYPVVENGKLVGLINRTQVLQALVDNDDDCYLR